jgi:hypothetical protein
MKKFILTLAILWASAIWADEGIPSLVELVNGTKQAAQFLGVQNDTVSLGGTIQGKFTVIRIPKNRFKSIVDEKGNDLLNGTIPQQDSVDQSSAEPNSDIQDSTQAEMVEAPHSIPFLDSVEGKHVFVSFERRNSESNLAEQLENLMIRLIKESGTPLYFVSRQDINVCSNAACIRDSLKAHGAATAYIGRITSARTPDSVAIQMSRYTLEDSTQAKTNTAQINLSAVHALTDALSKDKLHRFVLRVQGERVPEQASNGKSYVRVETNPEGANIVTKGNIDICKSPCTFVVSNTEKTEVYAYWGVDRQLWGAKTTINPLPGDTAKVSLKLKRVKPELLIHSKPEGAYIFGGSAKVTKTSKPIGAAPKKFPIYDPGFSTVQLRMEGFRDTTLTVFAAPTEITNVNVELTPITDQRELLAQQDWLKQRKKHFIGKTLMGSSIAPLFLGALFMYLASLDYDDADKIKTDLDRPAAGGDNFQSQASENKELVDKGDKKMIIGGTLFGTGILLLGVGFVLTF